MTRFEDQVFQMQTKARMLGKRRFGPTGAVVVSAVLWLVIVLVGAIRGAYIEPIEAGRALVSFILLGLVIYGFYRLLEKIYKLVRGS